MGFPLPLPQLVSSLDFWLPSTVQPQKKKRIQALQNIHMVKALAITTIARRSGVHIGKGVASLCGWWWLNCHEISGWWNFEISSTPTATDIYGHWHRSSQTLSFPTITVHICVHASIYIYIYAVYIIRLNKMIQNESISHCEWSLSHIICQPMSYFLDGVCWVIILLAKRRH